jgi:hypothetical protein
MLVTHSASSSTLRALARVRHELGKQGAMVPISLGVGQELGHALRRCLGAQLAISRHDHIATNRVQPNRNAEYAALLNGLFRHV